MGELIDAAEAARRLGVDVRSLYAYVSRGSLTRVRTDERRRSLYDSDAVQALVRRSRPRTHGPSRVGIDVVIGSAVTTISPGSLRYRGVELRELIAQGYRFEQVADLLWNGAPMAQWPALPSTLRHEADRIRQALRPGVDPLSAMVAGLAAVAALLPAEEPDEAAAVTASRNRLLVQVLVVAIRPVGLNHPESGGGAGTEPDVATALWMRLGGLRCTARRVRALDDVLIALADHELATSTLGVRVAASVRAPWPSAVITGIGTLSGSLHGGASELAHRALLAGSWAPSAVAGTAGASPDYLNRDPRVAVILGAAAEVASTRAASVEASIAQLVDRWPSAATVDEALAAFCFAADFSLGSGPAIFAVGRSAGWLAHATEERAERPLRFRARAVTRS